MDEAKKHSEEEENPNLEEHIKHHQQDKDMGGYPAGKHEGPELGSRGDQRKAKRDGEWNGSRTNNK